MTRSSFDGPDEAGQPPSSVEVWFLGHATTRIVLGGVRVLTDPFLRPRLGLLERHGPLPDPARLAVDIVLVSHGHPDHFDRRSLEALPGLPTIVVPRGLRARLGARLAGGEVMEMRAGESVVIGGMTIRAVPARHWISPGAARAEPIGYTLDAGPRVYFAGDTGPYAEMSEVAGGVDVALLPVWTWGPHLGPGHLGPRAAAQIAADIRAAAVVPIHWGTLYPRHLHRIWRRPLLEPGDRFAAEARRLAPDVDVRVLRPGEATTFEMARPRRPLGALPRSLPSES
jgi:L-ascorbate metabolism protein UlaG (beta-lactamase superfamily)